MITFFSFLRVTVVVAAILSPVRLPIPPRGQRVSAYVNGKESGTYKRFGVFRISSTPVDSFSEHVQNADTATAGDERRHVVNPPAEAMPERHVVARVYGTCPRCANVALLPADSAAVTRQQTGLADIQEVTFAVLYGDAFFNYAAPEGFHWRKWPAEEVRAAADQYDSLVGRTQRAKGIVSLKDSVGQTSIIVWWVDPDL